MHGGIQTGILILLAKTHSSSGCTVSKSPAVCQLSHSKLNPTLGMHYHGPQLESGVLHGDRYGARAERRCPLRIRLNPNGQGERREVVLACCRVADEVRIEAEVEARSSDLYLNYYQLDNSACEEYSLQSHGLIWDGLEMK